MIQSHLTYCQSSHLPRIPVIHQKFVTSKHNSSSKFEKYVSSTWSNLILVPVQRVSFLLEEAKEKKKKKKKGGRGMKERKERRKIVPAKGRASLLLRFAWLNC